jgi:putative membrane protein
MPFFGHVWILLVNVVIWGGLIALVVWAILRLTRRGSDNALGILKERFARGEIDQQEYEKRKRALEGP